MEHEVILMEDDKPVDLSLWIGTGRKLPEAIPNGLIEYFDDRGTVPSTVKDLFVPSPLTTVKDLLVRSLPKMTYSLPAINPRACFSSTKPNTRTSFEEYPIPSLPWIKKLNTLFRQAILDGMNSITDPKYPGLFFPLWCISFWQEMHKVHAIQEGWRKSVEWVEQSLEKEGSDELKEMLIKARTQLERLRWNERTLIPGADGRQTSTLSFSFYLSTDQMMGTDHINMMFAHLSNRIQADEHTDSMIAIVQLSFMFGIEKVVLENKRSDRTLQFLENKITNGELRALVFPVYMAKVKHWITIRIDFESGEIAYGDSLAHKGFKPPKDELKIVQGWLKKRFWKRKFVEIGDALAHGDQMDYTDCGILAANTAAHDVFEDVLWTPGRKSLERVSWFMKLSTAHINEINSSENETPYNQAVNKIALRSTKGIPTAMAHLLNPVNPPVTTTEPGVEDMASILDPGIKTSMVAVPDSNPSTHINLEIQNAEVNEIVPTKCGTKGGLNSSSTTLSWLTGVGEGKTSKEKKATKKRQRVTVPDEDSQPPRKVSKTEAEAAALMPIQFDEMSRRNVPIKRSTLWSRLQNWKFVNGQFNIDTERDKVFKATIQSMDNLAIIVDPKTVRHHRCGKELKMKTPYNTGNFKTHVALCKGTPKSHALPTGGMGINPLDTFFKTSLKDRTVEPLKIAKGPAYPCPGLCRTIYPQVDSYLERSGADGGGAESVSVLARAFFGQKYADVSPARQKQIRNAQVQNRVWRNNHQLGVVNSTECTRLAQPGSLGKEPCAPCMSILSKKRFKNAVRVPMPTDERFKFNNSRYRFKNAAYLYGCCVGLREIMEDKSDKPLIRYCKGVMSGTYKGDDMFGSLLQAVVVKQEKEIRGVGMQNFKYAPDLVEFAHIVHTHSPKAYQALKDFFPIPDPRTLKLHQSKQPRFPSGIQERTFTFTINKLKQLGYSGPVALSCDDSKLLASLRPYYDQDREGYYLMGHVGEPIELLDHTSFQKQVDDHDLQKATKLRLWCIQVPLPKIPTIIVAAESIPESLDALALLEYEEKIVYGFIERHIKIASHCSDGSNVERSAQRHFEQKATSTQTVFIKHLHSSPGLAPDYPIVIHFYGTQPIATIQDPKHLLKTFRNNLFSGARMLTFPKSIALFSQIRQIAYAPDSPIYIRDVEKADRQDDNAAARLFSGATLLWLESNHPEHLGLIVYLFVCGELIDAYQNRSMVLIDRVQLVLRAHYFIEMWEKFLDKQKYSRSRHYVSPQCADITRTLIQGFLQALIIYRDFSGPRQPFLPWLLATEVIEHVFGICRQIVKDFTMVDFHYMVPKLFVQLRQAALCSKFSDGKARASGYNHTYTDTRGIDLQALSLYPSDSDINHSAIQAFGEAESLFSLLGVTAADLYHPDPPPRLPGIHTWFQDDVDSLFEGVPEPVDEENAVGSGSDDSDSELDGLTYQDAMDSLKDIDADDLLVSSARKLMDYRYAAIAMSLEDREKIHSIPNLDDDDMQEAFAEDAERIASILSTCKEKPLLAPIRDSQQVSNPFDSIDPSSIDLSSLTSLRFSHQTKQAATGVRTSKQSKPALDNNGTSTPSPKAALSHRQQILRGFAEIIREQEERGVGTGLERAARWKNPAPGGRATIEDGLALPDQGTLLAGNSANAAVVADAAAKTALLRRSRIMAKAGLSLALWEARVSSVRPLRVGDVGFAISPTLHQFVACQVLAIYSKSTGKGSRHCDVTESSNIMAVSNIAVQVFEHQLGTQFRSIPHSPISLATHRFDLLPPSAFLCTVSAPPEVTLTGLKISLNDWALFKDMKKNERSILKACKLLAGKNKVPEENDE